MNKKEKITTVLICLTIIILAIVRIVYRVNKGGDDIEYVIGIWAFVILGAGFFIYCVLTSSNHTRTNNIVEDKKTDKDIEIERAYDEYLKEIKEYNKLAQKSSFDYKPYNQIHVYVQELGFTDFKFNYKYKKNDNYCMELYNDKKEVEGNSFNLEVYFEDNVDLNTIITSEERKRKIIDQYINKYVNKREEIREKIIDKNFDNLYEWILFSYHEEDIYKSKEEKREYIYDHFKLDEINLTSYYDKACNIKSVYFAVYIEETPVDIGITFENGAINYEKIDISMGD